MTEYRMEQRIKLSRAIANNSVGNKQLKGFIDNRIVQRTMKSKIHGISNSALRKVSQLFRVVLPAAPGAPVTRALLGSANITAISGIITGLYPGANAATVTGCARMIDEMTMSNKQEFMYLDVPENGTERGKTVGSFNHCTCNDGEAVITAFWHDSCSLKIVMVAIHGANNRIYVIKGTTNPVWMNKYIAIADKKKAAR